MIRSTSFSCLNLEALDQTIRQELLDDLEAPPPRAYVVYACGQPIRLIFIEQVKAIGFAQRTEAFGIGVRHLGIEVGVEIRGSLTPVEAVLLNCRKHSSSLCVRLRGGHDQICYPLGYVNEGGGTTVVARQNNDSDAF